MNRVARSEKRGRQKAFLGIAVMAVATMLAPGCESNFAPAEIGSVTAVPTAAFTATPPIILSPTVVPTTDDRETIIDSLAQAGVYVLTAEHLSTDQLAEVSAAVDTLGSTASKLFKDGESIEMPRSAAFARLFGPTEIMIYPKARFVDGVHAAVNCGWEGRFAQGCAYVSVYPEQYFPTGKWLILIAGNRIPGVTASEGRALVAHELAHNLTWGHGHLVTNVDGFNFVRYVGDEFAIKYFDTFGIHAGIDEYGSQAARAANKRWRSELTADAIASWSFGEINGPFADSIGNYVRLSMLCELYGGSDC